MRCDGRTTDEGYVALQAWLVGQLDPRTPHAADLFAQDSECLYDAFLSVLIGTGLGFADFDDDRTHHGLYAFDFFVGRRPRATPAWGSGRAGGVPRGRAALPGGRHPGDVPRDCRHVAR